MVELRGSSGDAKCDAELVAVLEKVSSTLPAPPNSNTRVLKINSRT